MKILYDYQAFYLQRYGGVSNCFVQLIKNLPEWVDYQIALKESDNVHLRDNGICNVPPMSCSPNNFLGEKPFKGKGRLFNLYHYFFPMKTSFGINRQASIDALKRGEFDVFHPTFFEDYFLPYLNRKPFVLTVHDMIPELFLKKNDMQVLKKPNLCRRAAHIITVSQKTKEDLVDILKVPEQKITVIYHGAPDNDIVPLGTPLVDGKYILYVGQRYGYKNFLLMAKHLVPVLLRHEDIKVVCTGPPFTKNEMDNLSILKVANRFVHYRVNDVELRNLYANALCFIYPSAYEGFGIPILEAYKANCPTLLNYASCFPEIAENAAVYFHLNSEQSDLDCVMEKFLNYSQEELKDLLLKQQQRLLYFSWKKSAQQLAEVYQSVM